MEVYSSSVEDQLVDGLSFKLSPGSSYVTDRQSVSFYPSGSNVYSTTSGTKILRFVINGDDWLDSSNTLRIFFDVRNNNTTKPLRVLGGPHCFFRRLRILCQNTLVEDIDMYARCHQMFDILRARHVRENEDCEGFEHRFDQPKFASILGVTTNDSGTVAHPGGPTSKFAEEYISVGSGKTRTVSFKPLSGLLNCGKLLPLRYCPITIELELCSSSSDPVISHLEDTFAPTLADATYSTDWQIENPCVKVDICVLDNALNNEYAALLLSGKALPINYSSYVSQQQSISGQNPSINITRALSRLKSVFVTLDQALTTAKQTDTDLHIQTWKNGGMTFSIQ